MQPGGPAAPDKEAETPLQFDHAEPIAPSPVAPCTVCKRALDGEYFEINAKVLCPTCRAAVEASLAKPVAGATFRATLLGVGAAIVGSLVFYAVEAVTGYQIGLVGIVVGVLVGMAVRRGSGNRGGKKFQAIAVGLTYLSIASTNLPAILHGVRDAGTKEHKTAPATAESLTPASEIPTPAPSSTGRWHTDDGSTPPKKEPTQAGGGVALALVFLFALVLASPFFGGVIGLVIMAIALWEAWKINRGLTVVVRGPFRIGG